MVTSKTPFWLSKIETIYNFYRFVFRVDDHCHLEEPNLFLWREYENYIIFLGQDINFLLPKHLQLHDVWFISMIHLMR